MEWLSRIRASIRYIKKHLLTIHDSSEAACAVSVSPFYLQKGFKLMIRYSMAEYIRNQRLYLTALDVLADKGNIMNLAFSMAMIRRRAFPRHFHVSMDAHRQS